MWKFCTGVTEFFKINRPLYFNFFKIICILNDNLIRDVVKSFGEDDKDDRGSDLATQAGRVAPTNSHYKRIEESSETCILCHIELELITPKIKIRRQMLL